MEQSNCTNNAGSPIVECLRGRLPKNWYGRRRFEILNFFIFVPWKVFMCKSRNG